MGLLLLPAVAAPVPVLLAIGLVQGLPVGVVMALPAEALRPESRATGMGLFYTGLYVGHAALPPVAGWLLDLSGSPAAPLAFAGVLVLCVPPLFAAFRAVQRRAPPVGAERAAEGPHPMPAANRARRATAKGSA